MAVEDFFVDIDMHLYQIKNLILHKNVVGSTLAQVGYNTTATRMTLYDGVSDKKVLQENDIIDEDDMVSDSNILVPTQQSVKAYIDDLETRLASIANGEGASMIGIEDTGAYFAGANIEAVLQEVGAALGGVTGGIKVVGDIDASTNPNYPAATLAGEAHVIIVAGKIGGASGEIVNVGDLVIAKNANAGGSEAAVGTDWFVLESNRDQATESILGVVKIATTALVDGGVNDTDAITPLKLKDRLSLIQITSHEDFSLVGEGVDALNNVTIGTSTFQVVGDITNHVKEGSIIIISGSTANDGTYTVVSAILNVGNTDVVVEETIPDATVDGNMKYGYLNTKSLSLVDATDSAQIQVTSDGKIIDFVEIKILSPTSVEFRFLSPLGGTILIGTVQGKFGF